MRKRAYRAVPFNTVDGELLSHQVRGQRLVVGIDVAKKRQYASLQTAAGKSCITVTFERPKEVGAFFEWLGSLGASKIEVVVEASGTYGDVLRAFCESQGHEVFQAKTHKVYAASEVFDDVPSMHDAKAAHVIANLHFHGLSRPWPMPDASSRSLRAVTGLYGLYTDSFRRLANQLEGLLARHWPELGEHIVIKSPTCLRLLSELPAPRDVSEDEEGALAIIKKSSRCTFAEMKERHLVEQAKCSEGLVTVYEERQLLCTVASEMLRLRTKKKETEKKIVALVEGQNVSPALTQICGPLTAAAIVTHIGDPKDYASSGALLKALGLNLKERSSGRFQGPLHISKRGPALPRQMLFLTALRYMSHDKVCAAWARKKMGRDGPRRGRKAVIALVRKLVKGLWHCARTGEGFDTSKLFDIRRLTLKEAACNA